MTDVFRLSSSRYPVNSGAGAAQYGGRWNKVGSEAIYTAESRSLAALEVLVHFSVIPKDIVLTAITIPEHLDILTPDLSALPSNWNNEAVSPETQAFGETWLRTTYPILCVPSTIILEERNFVINPKNPEFRHLRFGEPVPFRFDARLAGKTVS